MKSAFFISAAAAILLTGCAASSAESDPSGTQASGGNSCLRNASISGYRALDRSHVLVEAPTRSRTFLITTSNDCRELDFSNSMLIKSTTSCVERGDKIYVPEDMLASPNGCWIQTVEPVEDKDAALALIAQREAAEKAEDEK